MELKKTIVLLLFLPIFSECVTQKFDVSPPFEITEKTYNHWVGGQPGVSGTKVTIGYSSIAEVEFDAIYFKGKKAEIELSKEGNKTFLIGHFDTSNREEYDLVLDADTNKEINNKPPQQEKIPFKLKEDEAVISFKENGKIKFFKIENIKKIKSNFYE